MGDEILKSPDGVGCEYADDFVRELLANPDFVAAAKAASPGTWETWNNADDPDFSRAKATLSGKCKPRLIFNGAAPSREEAKAYIIRTLLFAACAEKYFDRLACSNKKGYDVYAHFTAAGDGTKDTCHFYGKSCMKIRLALAPHELNKASVGLMDSTVFIGVRMSGDDRFYDTHSCDLRELTSMKPIEAALAKYAQTKRW